MSHRTPNQPSGATFILAVLAALALSACGGGGDGERIPGAPTIGVPTSGDASASIDFTAPSSSGSSAVTSYTATCVAGNEAKSGSGSASPVTVSGLTNGTEYSCTVVATNAAGSGDASGAVLVTPVTGGGSTAGIVCDYSVATFNSSPSVNATSTSAWTCDSTSRVLSANGLPDHDVGTFPNNANPNTISAQSVAATYTLTPNLSGTTTQTGGPLGTAGYVLNGVKVDPATAGTCTDDGQCNFVGNGGSWNMEALSPSSFDFGTDDNNAHVQPDGAYHYHGMPEGFIALQNKGASMTLVGWASDGFPIYARYGYTEASSASSPIKVLTGSYQLKATPDTGRPSTSVYAMGSFQQDWEYVAGSGDLDECNGRSGVTPEFPGGTYYYAIADTYPFIQRCVKGTTAGGGTPPPPPGG